MTNQEILTKAIEKAKANGWKSTVSHAYIVQAVHSTSEEQLLWMIRGFVYDHDFAKALWGKKRVDVVLMYDSKDFHDGFTGVMQLWQFHLHKMVLSEDPIEYLGNNI